MKNNSLKDIGQYRLNYTSDISNYSEKSISYTHDITFNFKENFNYTLDVNTYFDDAQRTLSLDSSKTNLINNSMPLVDEKNILFTKYSKLNLSIPLNILSGNSALESIVLYLKEKFSLKYSEIAKILGRNQKTIWVTYDHAKKKGIIFTDTTETIRLPINIFYKQKFSVLETIVIHLKNVEDLDINSIANLLSKDYQTIWTVYRRAIKKIGGANAL